MPLPIALRMLGRSLLVQASWSFERLQAPGFFLTMLPALGRRRPGGPDAAQALRHLETFNTHPYFAGLIAATLAREEAGDGDPEVAAGLKRSLMCALGGIGDDLFWAHLRPVSALLALPLALAGSPWAVAVLLAVYNVPHLGVRVGGVLAGFARGRDVLTLLQSQALAAVVPAIGHVIPVLAGLLLGALAASGAWGVALPGGLLPAGGSLLLFAALLVLELRGVPPGLLVGCAALLALVGGLAAEVAAP